MHRREFLHRSGGTVWAASLGACDRRVAQAEPQKEVSRKPSRRPAGGPLRVHPDNRRYFTDGSGRAVYLTGSHTWANLVDMGPRNPPPRFDFNAYLDFLDNRNYLARLSV